MPLPEKRREETREEKKKRRKKKTGGLINTVAPRTTGRRFRTAGCQASCPWGWPSLPVPRECFRFFSPSMSTAVVDYSARRNLIPRNLGPSPSTPSRFRQDKLDSNPMISVDATDMNKYNNLNMNTLWRAAELNRIWKSYRSGSDHLNLFFLFIFLWENIRLYFQSQLL